MFQRVLAFHEVDPSFLDYVHCFGDQEEPLDAGLCHFQSDDFTTEDCELRLLTYADLANRVPKTLWGLKK